MRERLTYTITERLTGGQAELILYAWPDGFGGDRTGEGVLGTGERISDGSRP